ncbi:methyltransferase domain-containing protein, partial [Candidatus Pacearchaeota archaeon]|nr:methyltransferase domain-containing protein [Candidatus Pacearchaeota archaeon]
MLCHFRTDLRSKSVSRFLIMSTNDERLIGRTEKCLKLVLDTVHEGQDLLIVGCNNGWLEREMSKVYGTGIRITAIDIETSFLFAMGRPTHQAISYVGASVLDLPFKVQSFDVVIL